MENVWFWGFDIVFIRYVLRGFWCWRWFWDWRVVFLIGWDGDDLLLDYGYVVMVEDLDGI